MSKCSKTGQATGFKIIELVAELPRARPVIFSAGKCWVGDIGGANYRASCRGKSVADVISSWETSRRKPTTIYGGIDCRLETGARSPSVALKETDEILAMTVVHQNPSRPPLEIQNPKSKIQNTLTPDSF
jgi:hypothetical protein